MAGKMRALLVVGMTAALVESGFALEARRLPPQKSTRGAFLAREPSWPWSGGSQSPSSRARAVLEDASSLFKLQDADRPRGVSRPDPHDATLLLRDLALIKDELSAPDKRRANRILARPSDGPADPQGDGWGNFPASEQCDSSLDDDPDQDVCLRYITDPSSPDRVTNAYVASALSEIQTVWSKEIEDLGFKQPKDDNNSPTPESGPGLDVYFADIGADGLYGYCTTDEPDADLMKRVSAYCVLDNDYDPNQYDAPPPDVSGINALRVTLAHEFFHAVQFNYDWKEAPFLMEGTATWIEDEVYDDMDANYSFLFDSALHQPEISLDAFAGGDDEENFEYGAFVFFTWLSEIYDQGVVSIPVVAEVWEEAGATREGIGAVNAVVKARGYGGPSTPFRDFFAGWGVATYWYDFFYQEGADSDCTIGLTSYADVLRCQRPPVDGTYGMGRRKKATGWQRLRLDRLSNRFLLFFTGSAPRVKVTVDLGDRKRGGEATLVPLSGPTKVFRIQVNRSGVGVRSVSIPPTSPGILLVLSNTASSSSQTYRFKAEVE